MVLAIEKYPEFVPWCLNGKIHTKNEEDEKIEIIADLTIGKSFFHETYKSFVTYNKLTDTIHVKSMNGPLKHLENNWYFKQKEKNSEVDFNINFELKNNILNMLMVKSFDKVLKKIADAFEKRAIELFKRPQN